MVEWDVAGCSNVDSGVDTFISCDEIVCWEANVRVQEHSGEVLQISAVYGKFSTLLGVGGSRLSPSAIFVVHHETTIL